MLATVHLIPWSEIGKWGTPTVFMVGFFLLCWRFMPKIMENWSQQITAAVNQAEANRDLARSYDRLAASQENLQHTVNEKWQDSRNRHSEVVKLHRKQLSRLEAIHNCLKHERQAP